MTTIDKTDFTDILIDAVIKKLNEDKIKSKINEELVEPLIKNISDRLQPYMYTMSVAYSLILIPIILLLIIIIFFKSK
jgi:hypothetical protein